MWFNKIKNPAISFFVLLHIGTIASMDIADFFPEINGDLTLVTWAHAVNSNHSLHTALDSDVMMLEADIVLGTLIGGDDDIIPIMAHPPLNTSDLSLKEFLMRVIQDGSKGIKLDFKSTEAVEMSLTILRNNSASLRFPILLNADILRGPALNTGNPVSAEYFLSSCAEAFPASTLSVGWTTTWGPLFVNGSYTQQHVDEMIQELKESNVKQAVTFPVRAGITAHSLTSVTTLLAAVGNSTLTVWGSETDNVNFEKLANVILSVGRRMVYIDLPEKVRAKLDHWLNVQENTIVGVENHVLVKGM